jgi:RNA polymerase subunit RPABC4/transcription elongation factor Spt4
MSPCTNCGATLPAESRFCSSCGAIVQSENQANKASGNSQPGAPQTSSNIGAPITRFCRGCGSGLVQQAVICPNCGTSVSSSSGGTPKPKTKKTAVLFAVFLSFWTWLYTYKLNTWKFWVGLGVSVVGLQLYFIPSLAIWVWAIVDVATKPDSCFADYSW